MIGALPSIAMRANSLGPEGGLMNSINNRQNILSEGANTASFDQVLAKITESVGTKLQKAESLSMGKISGNDIGVREIVSSVMEAEQSLSTAIALRDKMVQAYLEVSRMQI
ncbi:hypothetical protein X471_01180 [Bartonella bacilliformis str. Heidi Mejia]|uniref:flagellar hook-basal body complex protein FliE n=1 Tax=Bartonella bacilliformis TaxID=774 RepID=UPI000447CB5C|nr:hypothetical protein X471_01180 [Bartonella bacilliformis str. Heidi Mejia]KEG16145.1 hypothetical protein H705_01071 [Bartonella bacilliformis Cond044]KEG18134.1 hypothetical protein H707_01010 [Bartonella bacilliformis Hosp800-02]KEG21762.1 hypothetical protein H708_01015 [Bartonella bacilliformis VAB9028]KEG23137.1 hypothetical protein H706_01025 [Bartonella bacilliformis CAR600-02]